MNFKSILKGISLLSLISQVQCGPVRTECQNLSNYFTESNNETTTKVLECVENDKGEITSLYTYGTLTNEDLEKIASLSSLVDLKIYNEKKSLDLSIFENLTKLKSLNLVCRVSRYNNSKSEMLEKSFSGLKNLNKLELHGYVITQETIDGISTLTNLEELTFSTCFHNNEVNYDSLINIKDNIKALNIDSHGYRSGYLNTIPEAVYSLTNLKNLTITGNNVSVISDKITQLKNLESLDLSNDLFTEIPSVLNELPKLKYVSFENNNDLKGKALTNKGLVSCNYSSTSVCKPKELSCLTEDIESCPEVTVGCDNIKNTFADNEITITINSCVENENGEVTNLTLSGNNNQSVIDIVANISSLKQLVLNEKTEDMNLEALKKLENLTDLEVTSPTSKTNSKRFKILKDSLKDLKIKNLNLKGIYIDQDLVNDISAMTKLESLIFSTCDFVEDTDFTPFESLDTLTVFKYIYHIYTAKRLTEIPESIYSLTNLKELAITKNEIATVSDKIVQLQNLEYLNLSGNKIKEIPESLNQLPKLKYVNFESNSDISGIALNNESLETCLYGTVDYICKTKELSCLEEGVNVSLCDSKNECKEIKDILAKKNIKLSSNNCSTNENGEVVFLSVDSDVIDDIVDYHSITDLTLYVSNVEKIDLKPLRNLSLTTLILESSYDDYIDIKKSSLKYLTGLKKLDIKYFKISQDNINEIKNLTNLEELSFLNCKFAQYTKFDGFKKLTKLTSLNIDNSNGSTSFLTSIPSSFYSLTNLKKLSLRSQKITSISSRISNLTKLEELDLQSNELKSLPSSLKKLTKLKNVNFSYNSDLTGKTLTNDSIEVCRYASTNLCIAKEMECHKHDTFANLMYC